MAVTVEARMICRRARSVVEPACTRPGHTIRACLPIRRGQIVAPKDHGLRGRPGRPRGRSPEARDGPGPAEAPVLSATPAAQAGRALGQADLAGHRAVPRRAVLRRVGEQQGGAPAPRGRTPGRGVADGRETTSPSRRGQARRERAERGAGPPGPERPGRYAAPRRERPHVGAAAKRRAGPARGRTREHERGPRPDPRATESAPSPARPGSGATWPVAAPERWRDRTPKRTCAPSTTGNAVGRHHDRTGRQRGSATTAHGMNGRMRRRRPRHGTGVAGPEPPPG
jgi:hypothetical protein